MVGDDGKALVSVDQLHDGHRSHKVKEDFGNVTQMFNELVCGEEIDERVR